LKKHIRKLLEKRRLDLEAGLSTNTSHSVSSRRNDTHEDNDYLNVRQASDRYWKRQEDRQRTLDKPKDVLTILKEFHNKSKNSHKRLYLLCNMSLVVVREVSIAELRNSIKRFNDFKDSVFPLEGNWCWLCNKNPAQERHHVILLKNGGPELNKQNVIYLCSDCHCIISPWLCFSPPSNDVSRISYLIRIAKEGIYTRSQVQIEIDSILDSLFSTN